MVYPSTHLYVTAHWEINDVEQGQIGFRVNQSALPSQGESDGATSAFASFWSTESNGVPGGCELYEVKFALIGPDGRYPEAHVPLVNTFAAINGAGGVPIFPNQIACVTSLEGAVPRGNAGRGRVYMPAFNYALGNGQWSTATLGQRNAGMITLIESINTALTGDVCIFSAKSQGFYQRVEMIRTGSRPDVQRRRARSVTESYVVGQID